MSEFVVNIGSPGVGALANGIWPDQAREIKANGHWRKAWDSEARCTPWLSSPVPVRCRAAGPDALFRF